MEISIQKERLQTEAERVAILFVEPEYGQGADSFRHFCVIQGIAYVSCKKMGSFLPKKALGKLKEVTCAK